MTMEFRSIPIFKVGTWNGHEWKDADLEAMVDAYNKTKGNLSVPIKIGHGDRQKLLNGDDLPAAGYLENIRKVGSQIYADLMQVPDKIGKLIQSGAYRARSVEINKNFDVEGKTYPTVLTGMALLGATLPAVSGLDDIVKLYAAKEIPDAVEDAEIAVFNSEEFDEGSFEQLMGELDIWADRAEGFFKGKVGAPTLRQLHRAYKEKLRGLNKSNNSKEEEEIDMALSDDIRKALGLKEDADVLAAVRRLKNRANREEHSDDDEDEDDDDSALKAENSTLARRILELEKINMTNEASAAVEVAIRSGKLLPKQKEFAIKMALSDRKAFDEFVKTQPDVMSFKEVGSSQDTDNLSKFEPSADEVTVAKQMGLWSPEHRINLMRQKAAAAGVELPLDSGKEKVASKEA